MKQQRKKKKMTFESSGGLGGLGALLREAGFESTPVTEEGPLNSPSCPASDPQRIELNPESVRFRKERKGRGGKTVTVLEGHGLTGDALASFVKQMKAGLGVGAHIESDRIVLQGDVVERARVWLEQGAFF